MQLLVILGGLTFFARCWDQAQPYWKVIGGSNKKAPAQSEGEARRTAP